VRDGFYHATVNKVGWPYVQLLGGTTGILKVLDNSSINYANFRGNIQYLGVGNMVENNRMWLILVGHANRRRLKNWS
jgi:predicted pyridoxine 5'-phosphate oxidase superfamily flavin-nucleotide-binding protein